jgi:hypothetical protein
MYAAGAATKVATVFFFMFIMTGGFCNSIFCLIAAIICTGTSYARQQQQVDTEYEQDFFHAAKIASYKTLFTGWSKYYHNKVATILIIEKIFVMKSFAIVGSKPLSFGEGLG